MWNKYQTQEEEINIDSLPDEVREDFYECLNIPFIKWLISPDRPKAKDLPRDDKGRIIVDVTKPHILEDMDYFRPTALHFQKTGRLTDLKPNGNPNSAFGKWIHEEVRRCREGYVRESDGEWVTGDMYYLLNYCPIEQTKTTIGKRKGDRIVDFPEVWDGINLRYHYMEQAANGGIFDEKGGLNGAEISSRGKSKSICMASKMTKYFTLGESAEINKRVKVIAAAYSKEYLNGNDGILTKFQNFLDFVATDTQFPHLLLKNNLQDMNWIMGWKNLDNGAREGTLNQASGIAIKDDISKIRGKRQNLIVLEEFGSFANVTELYNIMLPCVREGSFSFGQMYAIGCVCAGTKVVKPNGELINIEDVNIDDKLLGYNGNKTTEENISWKQPEAYKECVRIETEKSGFIECSIDHPLLALNKDDFGHSKNTCSFYLANELNVGDTLLGPRIISEFGNIDEPNAFLLGALFGDGNYSSCTCPTLSITTNEEYEYYNEKYNIGISKIYCDEALCAQIYFVGIRKLLEKYNMWGEAFERKRLPYNIFDWNKKSVCDFLSGYFNADGNVQIVKNNYRTIKLTCRYKSPLDDVKSLLSKLGISSHIYKEQKPERLLISHVNHRTYQMPKFSAYVLYISNSKDVCIFRDNIRFLIKKKQDRLDSYVPPKKSKCVSDNIRFVLKDNKKGKNFIDKEFNNVFQFTIKKIEKLGVRRVFNMTADTTHTYISNGFISSNTAGDNESDFQKATEIIYNPKGYYMYALPNVYDKPGEGRNQITFFYPEYLNRKGFYDKNGNSDVTGALIEILLDRYRIKYNTTDLKTITKNIAERPITPQEAIMRAKGNKFPVNELNQRLNELDANNREFDDVYVGELVETSSGEVEFRPTNGQPIRIYPIDDNMTKGALEIFSMPQTNSDGKVPSGRYCIGVDPVDNDYTTDSTSLYSCLVLDLFTDNIVAEYTGRTEHAEDAYEITRKLCMFYNCKCMFENNIKGLFSYFSKMNCLYMLADTPEYLRDRELLKIQGTGNVLKGIRATKPINNYEDDLIKEWLIQMETVVTKDDNGNEIEIKRRHLFSLRNRALIQELIQYSPLKNVDRLRALGILMLYREQFRIAAGGDVTEEQETSSNNLAFDPFFTRILHRER